MEDVGIVLVTIGGLLLLGLVTDVLGRYTPLPRVTFLILLGILIGPDLLDILPDISDDWFEAIADMALVMVGFLLGEKLTISSLREHGRAVLWISSAVVVTTLLVTLGGLALIGQPIVIALLLAGIATATDPAATTDVIREARAQGRFSRVLEGVVAIDDAWGLLAFSFMLTAAQVFAGDSGGAESLLTGLWEIGGAILIGVGLGVPLAYLSGRIKPGERTLSEAVGAVFLCGGIAIWLNVSFLLAAMIMGAVVANLSHRHRPFHAIQGIEWPFMILFFLLAGASLEIDSLPEIGAIGIGFVVFRIIGRIFGGWAGARLSHADPSMSRWMGASLMPQAGVALGMALVASQRLPEIADVVLPVVIASTVLFEVIGPVMTKIALIRVGDAHKSPK
ncbi:MAG: cation:proton antiporter [Chloroflexi bacterium]|jgi:Kef-type K+ transport system membrane component KefB|nr:cation:proton antiporter [Chloroflexota bacterium]